MKRVIVFIFVFVAFFPCFSQSLNGDWVEDTYYECPPGTTLADFVWNKGMYSITASVSFRGNNITYSEFKNLFMNFVHFFGTYSIKNNSIIVHISKVNENGVIKNASLDAVWPFWFEGQRLFINDGKANIPFVTMAASQSRNDMMEAQTDAWQQYWDNKIDRMTPRY